MTQLKIPERIGRISQLSYNLWWSWHPDARELFRVLDYSLWHYSGHNPVKQLGEISHDRLESASSDPAFLNLYDSVMATFDADMVGNKAWYAGQGASSLEGPMAYFAMEFAIHYSLPIYAGGLGVLSGDTCKEASDLGLPVVAVGFMYPEGYFHQRMSPDGWQQETYHLLNFNEAPISPCSLLQEGDSLTQIRLGERVLYIRVWLVRMGRVNVYLLDTNVEKNSLQDRQLSARLYTSDPEQRIQQEIVLGIGGVRVLRSLGIRPSVWHVNEGHTAFMMVERLREEMELGTPFLDAIQRVKEKTIFTTHTPVMAGHDIFPVQLVDKYLDSRDSYGIFRDALLSLGHDENGKNSGFNMSVLALRLSGYHNAVSELHENVTRRMWQHIWPETSEENVPISHVTNGVHVPTWIAPELGKLYEKYLSQDWIEMHDDPDLWERVLDIPDEEIWVIHELLKRKLLSVMMERNRQCTFTRECTAQQIVAMGSFLDAQSLTIGFARRFVAYKRPALIFSDIERLKRIVNDRRRPVQIVFAGKSHPADFHSKSLLHQVYEIALGREFEGRIAFIEDYDIHIAHNLVQGVDVWLNTPRRLQEACGTSGMKASLNGVLNLSVRDGWWNEGYNGTNGWVIGPANKHPDPAEEDGIDTSALYDILENTIVPLYYTRDRAGVPREWVRMLKEAIRSVTPRFSAKRMMKEYAANLYFTATR